MTIQSKSTFRMTRYPLNASAYSDPTTRISTQVEYIGYTQHTSAPERRFMATRSTFHTHILPCNARTPELCGQTEHNALKHNERYVQGTVQPNTFNSTCPSLFFLLLSISLPRSRLRSMYLPSPPVPSVLSISLSQCR